MSGPADMTCGPSRHDMVLPAQRILRLDPSLPQLVASGRAASRPRTRIRLHQRRLPGVNRLLVALAALVGLDARVCEILDPRSRPHSITNCTCCIAPQATLLALQPTPRAVIDFVYSLRISPVLCGPYTHGLQRQRSAIFGSPRRFENANHRVTPARSRAGRVSTLAATKSQNLAPQGSSTSTRT